MADLLGIGSSGIGVAQQALSTVSNNIANLSTDGYSRQTTEIRQAQPKDVGNGYRNRCLLRRCRPAIRQFFGVVTPAGNLGSRIAGRRC